ncbi:MAG TPA: endonuclease/exonuclease/phosphatase family protein [Candidatus Omnitrophota bacterium]|nr:endonuclease/exonuclease/phosphatase family protein [Candidatus Omnitrophota bacterium]
MRRNIRKISIRAHAVRLGGVFLLLCLALTSCANPFRFINYSLSNTPRYSMTANPPYKNIYKKTIKVVSYNIKHSARIREAIHLLKNNPNLADADILLLQEMIPSAVEKIAADLGYNYIFYPAVIHPLLHDNFGNAVLSKWPITYDENIIFPSIKENSRHRVAVAAKLKINEKDVMVYSLHMGIFMKPRQRGAQIQTVLDAINKDIKYCIVAGDFNTIKEKDEEEIIRVFSESHFTHATSNVDWTYKHWYFLNYKSTFDHIFVRGPKVLNAGKIDNLSPSDHLPVWAEFSLE